MKGLLVMLALIHWLSPLLMVFSLQGYLEAADEETGSTLRARRFGRQFGSASLLFWGIAVIGDWLTWPDLSLFQRVHNVVLVLLSSLGFILLFRSVYTGRKR